VGELFWPVKAAGCVLHDYLFFIGMPFGRANRFMARAHRYFGNNSHVRVVTRWLGVWVGGYMAYRSHRRKEKQIDGYGTQTYIDRQIEFSRCI